MIFSNTPLLLDLLILMELVLTLAAAVLLAFQTLK